jgi:D-3-phosphoglycerate dehydrogenase
MVVEQVRDYLENGSVRNSVNFPEMMMPRSEGYRLAIVNENVPNMLGQLSTCMAAAGLNILDMLNKSRSELAYTLVDVDAEPHRHACSRWLRSRVCSMSGHCSGRLPAVRFAGCNRQRQKHE